MGIAKQVGRVIRGPFQNWGIEVAMRYLPVAGIVKRHGLAGEITEIGSGSYGITPYLRRHVTGVDTHFFEGQQPLLTQVKGSVLEIPYKAKERSCVISVDMLEHLPPDLRAKSIDELVRISGKLLVMAFPSGKAAQEQDRFLASYYEKHRGEPYQFLLEHLDNGLPEEPQVKKWVDAALTTYGRKATVTYTHNSSLWVRLALMKLWIRDNPFSKLIWILLNYLHPIFTRLNADPCYRLIVTVEFHD